MQTESIQRLEAAGFHYKPSESPEIWTHLESYFMSPAPIGPRFGNVAPSRMAEMIARGEDVLLESLMAGLQSTGKPGPVTQVIEMPYIVGTAGAMPLAAADPAQILQLIDLAGTAREHIIYVVPTEADAIPGTRHMTVTGGLYADGHTAGYYDLCPGTPVKNGPCAWLATADDVHTLAQDMMAKAEEIGIVTQKECEAMLARVQRLLG